MPEPWGPVSRASGPPGDSSTMARRKCCSFGLSDTGSASAHGHGTAEGQRMSAHLADGRPDEQLERHHRADRVSRQADPGNPAEQPEAHRRARPHPQLPEPLLGTELVEHGPDVVVLADADAGRGDQKIAIERALEVLAQALRRVSGDAEIHRLAAGVADQRHERVGVAARRSSARSESPRAGPRPRSRRRCQGSPLAGRR